MSSEVMQPTVETLSRFNETLSVPSDLVFIMIKPLAMENHELSSQIMHELAKHGQIEHAQSSLTTQQKLIEGHYKGSRDKMYYPPLVHYLTDQRITHFVLRDHLPIGAREGSFADYLREHVIGPSDPNMTHQHHIRNWTIQQQLDYKINVNLPDDKTISGYRTAFDNLVHCSDSTISALDEIANWYTHTPEVVQYYSDEFELMLQHTEEYEWIH